jgi:hypothetical protein
MATEIPVMYPESAVIEVPDTTEIAPPVTTETVLPVTTETVLPVTTEIVLGTVLAMKEDQVDHLKKDPLDTTKSLGLRNHSIKRVSLNFNLNEAVGHLQAGHSKNLVSPELLNLLNVSQFIV